MALIAKITWLCKQQTTTSNRSPTLRRGHNVQGIEATANGDIIGQSYENHHLSKIIRFNGSNNLYFAGHKFLAKYT